MRFVRTHFIGILIVLFSVSPSEAQEQADRRRQFVQGLLKTFIDSQLPRDTSPGQQTPGTTRSNQSKANTNRLGAAEIHQASQLLSLASAEMSQLVGALQGDIYRAQGVRQLLSLAMNVNADAAVLSRRLARANDVEALREPLRKLDQNWRTLEYRLEQTPNLSRNTLENIERIRQYEKQLASMFNVATQVDIAAISEQAMQMNSALRNLLEDIRYEIPDTNQATQLLQEGRDTYDHLQSVIQTTRVNTSYDALKQEFNSLESAWTRYQTRLRLVSNRFVQRQAQRIDDSMRNLKGLLYLATGQVSRKDVLYSTQLLQRDTDQLLSRINLKMLADLPAARRYSIEAAGDFATSCQDLLDVLEAGDDVEVIRDMFRLMYDEWQRLNTSLQGISSQEARQSIRDVERSLSELQSQLGVQLDLDRNEAMELAADLLSGARHMQDDMRDVFGRPNRYPRDFQTNSLRAAAQFQLAAAELHTQLANGDKLLQLKSSCESMSSAWSLLEQYIPRFDTSEQIHLTNIRRQLTPNVVRLQTLLTL